MAAKSSKRKKTTKSVIPASARARVETTKTPASTRFGNGQRPWYVRLAKPYIFLLALIIIIVLLFYFKNLFVAAMVNGQPISRFTVIHNLEKKSGKQELNTLILKTLVYQEANKRNIKVSDKEVQDELKRIEDNFSKSGQKLDVALASQGLSRGDLIDQIRLEKIIEKMVSKEMKVTDQEVQDYIDKNKDTLPQDQSEDQQKTSVRKQLEQQKLSDKIQSWIRSLQANAKITYFVNY